MGCAGLLNGFNWLDYPQPAFLLWTVTCRQHLPTESQTGVSVSKHAGDGSFSAQIGLSI